MCLQNSLRSAGAEKMRCIIIIFPSFLFVSISVLFLFVLNFVLLAVPSAHVARLDSCLMLLVKIVSAMLYAVVSTAYCAVSNRKERDVVAWDISKCCRFV